MDSYKLELGFALRESWKYWGPRNYYGSWLPLDDDTTITSFALTKNNSDTIINLSPSQAITYNGITYILLENDGSAESALNWHYRPSFGFCSDFLIGGDAIVTQDNIYNIYWKEDSERANHFNIFQQGLFTVSADYYEAGPMMTSYRSRISETSAPRPVVFLSYKYSGIVNGEERVVEFAYGHFSGMITVEGVSLEVTVYDEPVIANSDNVSEDWPYLFKSNSSTFYKFKADYTSTPDSCFVGANSYVSLRWCRYLVFKEDGERGTDRSKSTFVYDGSSIISDMSQFSWQSDKAYQLSDVVYSSNRNKYYRSKKDDNHSNWVTLAEGQEEASEDDVFPAVGESQNEYWEEVSESDIISASMELLRYIRTGTLTVEGNVGDCCVFVDGKAALDGSIIPYDRQSHRLELGIKSEFNDRDFRILTNELGLGDLKWNWYIGSNQDSRVINVLSFDQPCSFTSVSCGSDESPEIYAVVEPFKILPVVSWDGYSR